MAQVQNNVIILNELDPRYSTVPLVVASGAVSTIQAGTPTKAGDAYNTGSWTGAVIPMVDADGTTSQRFTGICKTSSNETATVAGTTVLWLPLPGYVYATKSKVLTDTNTAAKIQALFGKSVIWDLTSSLWSVDASASNAVTNCLVIIGGDYLTSTLWFQYKYNGTFVNQITTAV